MIVFYGLAVNASITQPTGMTERGEISSGKTKMTTEVADANQQAIGSTGPRVATSSTAAVSVGHTIALRRFGSTPLQPPAPLGLTAVSGNNQVALTWMATPGAITYNLYRSASSGGPFDLSQRVASNLSLTGYTDSTVVNNTSYFYVVRAVNQFGESPNSQQASVIAGCQAITIVPSSLPSGIAGAFYSVTLSATGGVAPYQFSLTAGTLPSGLILSSDGVLSGTSKKGAGGRPTISTLASWIRTRVPVADLTR